MCSLGRANVFSFGADVSSFRANVFSFWPNVFSFEGHVFTLAGRCVQFLAGRPGWGWGADGRRDSLLRQVQDRLRRAQGRLSGDVEVERWWARDGGEVGAALVRWDRSGRWVPAGDAGMTGDMASDWWVVGSGS